MRKLLNNRYFKMAGLGILFLIASFFTYYGFYLVVPMITSYGRFTLNYLPVVFTFWTFLFTFMMLWLYVHNFQLANKVIILRIYGLVVSIVESVSVIIHIIMISIQYGWEKISHVVSPLFPYDVLLLMICFLAIGVTSLVIAHKMKKNLVLDQKQGPVIRKRSYVAFLLLAPFVNYYLGLLLSSFNFMDSIDPNAYGMIPIIISFIIPYLAVALFFLYRHIFQKKYKFQLIALFSLLGFTIAIYVWALIALLINPSLIIESMTNFFILGYAIKIPLGLYINVIITFSLEIIGAVYFIIRTRKLANEQK